jgi:hypothetical protein
MPDKHNIDREEHMDAIGIPYKNIYPALKSIYIQDEEKKFFPKNYYLLDVPEHSKQYYQELR